MALTNRIARLSKADIEDLAEASNSLAALHAVITRANPQWKDLAETHIIRANDVVLRIAQKGANSIQRAQEHDERVKVALSSLDAQEAAAAGQGGDAPASGPQES